MLEQRFCKPLVGSSILSPGTNKINDLTPVFDIAPNAKIALVNIGVNISRLGAFWRALALFFCFERRNPVAHYVLLSL
jgi:hypothetical protein